MERTSSVRILSSPLLTASLSLLPTADTITASTQLLSVLLMPSSLLITGYCLTAAHTAACFPHTWFMFTAALVVRSAHLIFVPYGCLLTAAVESASGGRTVVCDRWVMWLGGSDYITVAVGQGDLQRLPPQPPDHQPHPQLCPRSLPLQVVASSRTERCSTGCTCSDSGSAR